MSQPKQFGPNESDPLGVIIESHDQLVTIFSNSEKKPDLFCMGIEHELFAQDKSSSLPLQFDGQVSIQTLFAKIVQKTNLSSMPFSAILENNKIVALTSSVATIALEPGGQIEIAARPASTLSTLAQDLDLVVDILVNTSKELNINLFALGLHPTAQQEDMASVKKYRYQIMKQYMQKLGGRGLDMMLRSAAIQANIDFSCEKDMAQKMRLAAILSPLYSLLFTSGAFLEGSLTKHYAERSHIWQQTDPHRTGIPACIFAPDFGYRSWIEFALDVPMYFIRRENNYINLTGSSFRNFIKIGIKNYKATIRDFVDHLSTIFTEVRLKPFIELRSPDSLPVIFTKSFAALCWAHFYHPDCFIKLNTLFESTTHHDIIKLQEQVIHKGPKAIFLGKPVFEVLEILYNYAQISLEHSSYLDILKPIIHNKQPIQSYLRSKYSQNNQINMHKLVENFSPEAINIYENQI